MQIPGIESDEVIQLKSYDTSTDSKFPDPDEGWDSVSIDLSDSKSTRCEVEYVETPEGEKIYVMGGL